MPKIFYHPRSIKFLKKVLINDRKKIVGKIELLKADIQNNNLNIKKLVNTKQSFRLRIGNIRVLYEYEAKKDIIYINNIDFRGNVY